MNFRDAEQLSEYLDGRLEPSEVEAVERRLAVDAGLRQLLDDLRVARGILRRVPRRRSPRNFTLSPSNARVSAPRPLSVPILRYAGAVASLLFVFAVAVNTLSPVASRALLAASAPALGVGGGMGGGGGGSGQDEGDLQTQAAAPAGTPPAEAPLAPQSFPAPTAEAFARTAPPVESPKDVQPAPATAPISPLLVVLLAISGVLLVGFSIYLDRRTRGKFHSHLLQK